MSPVAPVAGNLLLLSVGTFGAVLSSLTVTDDGSGPGYMGWQPLVPSSASSTIQVSGLSSFNLFWKISNGTETTLTYAWAGGTPTSMWAALDCIGGFTGIPTLDPRWLWNPTTTGQFITTTVTASGVLNTSGQCPIASGLSHQATEFIYAVGFTPRSNGGLGAIPFQSNSPSFPNLSLLNFAPSITADLNTAWCLSTAQFGPASGNNDTCYEQWTTSRGAVVVALAFFDPGPASVSPSAASSWSFAGTPTITVGLAPTAKYTLESSVYNEQGQEQGGVAMDAYLVNRFQVPPQQGDPVPDSNPPDAGPVISGGTDGSGLQYGSPGRWRMKVTTLGDYYVRAYWQGVNYWGRYASGQISGRPISGLIVNASAAAVGPLVLGSPSAGTATSGIVAAADHAHDPGTAYAYPGELHQGTGGGEAARILPGPNGNVLTVVRGLWVPQPPVPSIAGVAINGAYTLPGPGEYFCSDSVGSGYDIQFPDATSCVVGVYRLHYMDPVGGFIRHLPHSGQTFDGASQFGFLHRGDEIAYVPNASTGEWAVVSQPSALGYLFTNNNYLSAYPNSSPTQINYFSPGPFTGASLSSVVGSGSSWSAILTVTETGFIFFGTDVAYTGTGYPYVNAGTGMSGSCMVAAVGQIGHPNNQAASWPAGQTQVNLNPNQALVVAKGSSTLTGSGSITWNARRQPPDAQYLSGAPAAPMDGRYGYCTMVVPPSGVFAIVMAMDYKSVGGSNFPVGFEPCIALGGVLSSSVTSSMNQQDLYQIKGSADALIPGNVNNYTRIVDYHIAQTMVLMNGAQLPIPGGFPAVLYWMMWPDASGSTKPAYGDGCGYEVENVPYQMDVRVLPNGGNVNGVNG